MSRRLIDESEDLPEDLPESKQQADATPINNIRTCPDCGKAGRVISNSSGVNVFCNTCKKYWPLSGPRLRVDEVPHYGPRGLSKQTVVVPDLYGAFDNIDDEE